jgi:dUTP pyrophosphatase
MSSDMIEESAPVKTKDKPKAEARNLSPGIDLGVVSFVSPAEPVAGETNIYKLYFGVETPEYKTEQAACFDLHAFLGNDIQSVKGYSAKNFELDIPVRDDGVGRYILLQPGDRALIPTGLIFDLPAGTKMHIYPRSGTALKKGLNLANGVAVIDSDYVEQTFILLTNNTTIRAKIEHNERIAQAEIAPTFRTYIAVTKTKPAKKGNRAGGFNSTGTK